VRVVRTIFYGANTVALSEETERNGENKPAPKGREAYCYSTKSNAALLVKLGIFQGRSNKLLAPGDTMSRGEAAATVLRMLKSIQ